jgi:superfamily II DNA/RNA helicase
MSDGSFRALGVRPHVVEALLERGIESPFPIQRLVLPDALAGVDVLAKSPTGSGKTLAFGLAIVERTSAGGPASALVLVPTRELASQVAEELRAPAAAAGLRVEAIYGGVPLGGQARQVEGAEIVVATPGRLQDLADRGLVSLGSVEMLVLDEADRMLDMGFRPQVDAIVGRLPRTRQTMFFSATLDERLEISLAPTRTTRVDSTRLHPRAWGKGSLSIMPSSRSPLPTSSRC